VKVVVANRFFYPDIAATGQLAADLAFDLAQAGLDVHVVTSRLAYDAGPGYAAEETVRGVRVHRVWTSRYGRASLPGRMVDYASFYIFATWRLLRLLRPGDVVVALTDPPLLSVCASWAARWRGARLVNWIQDLFPEAAAALGFNALQGLLGAPLRAMRDRSLRFAVTNVALGERMATLVRDRIGPGGSTVCVIHNWANGALIRGTEPEQVELRSEWGLADRFVVGYSGNMGRAHDIETLIASCVALKDDPGIAFVFIGGGAKRSLLQQAMIEHQLQNVRMLPYVESARLSEALGACDAHLVTLLPAAEGLIVPSKFYGIAAAARPAIFVGDPQGEVARLIKENDCGVCVSACDEQGLAEVIRTLSRNPAQCRALGARARQAFEREWDKPIALAKWRAILGGMRGKASSRLPNGLV
jgi:glycosyltransferase involved in cell wall biosynthesis